MRADYGARTRLRPAPAAGRRRAGAAALLFAAFCLLLIGRATSAAEVSATARSEGYASRCAEMDNVLIALTGPAVRRFEVAARHPPYLAGREGDSMAADFTDCVFPSEPIWERADTFDKILFEDDRILLRGLRFARTWRPEEVPLRIVGGDVFEGVQLVQLHLKRPGKTVEVAVLYPQDGYWRFKPPPPAGRDETGFGSSLLIGPVERDRRPLVRLRAVAFDPAAMTFRLDFAAGGGATARIASISPDELRIAVAFDAPVADEPFALLSSMHVAPDNADVSQVAVRRADQPFWERTPVDAFSTGEGADFVFGRETPSRHNYSAPDLAVGRFRAD